MGASSWLAAVAAAPRQRKAGEGAETAAGLTVLRERGAAGGQVAWAHAAGQVMAIVPRWVAAGWQAAGAASVSPPVAVAAMVWCCWATQAAWAVQRAAAWACGGQGRVMVTDWAGQAAAAALQLWAPARHSHCQGVWALA